MRVQTPATLPPRKNNTSEGVAPLEDKIDEFLKTMKLPTSTKSLQRVRSILQEVHTTPGRRTHANVQATTEECQVPDDTTAQGHHL